jgi:hypothetical protein
METLIAKTETTATTETTEKADLLAIVELGAHELALVGGGTANVCFL